MEKTIRKNEIYSGKIINVRCDDVLLENGREGKREVVDHPGGAAILCVREGKVILVRQFRYAYQEEILEIPAGKLNRGEDPRAAAAREFEEETGLIANRLTLLFEMYPSPGYSDEIISVYRAEEVHAGRQHLDEDEFLTVVEIPVQTALEMAGRGEIKDAKTLAAILTLLATTTV